MKTQNYKSFSNALSQDMYSAVVFLCTPRCGTQWISKNISELYTKEAVTLHEPLDNEYHLRKNLRIYGTSAEKKNSKVLAEHLDFVDEITRNMIYIEVGWQSIAGIAKLYRRFPDRLKVIHLYRNPVKVAASLVTHNWYTGKVKERFEKAELTPFDKGAILSEYQDRWDSLSLYEKSLYYWTEVNMRALEIKNSYSRLPFFSLQFEHLFEERKEIQRMTLIEMLSFMGLSYNEKIHKALDEKYDKFRSKTAKNIDWKELYNHPQTIVLAEKLGYTFEDEISLSRYKAPIYKVALYKVKSFLKKMGGRGVDQYLEGPLLYQNSGNFAK